MSLSPPPTVPRFGVRESVLIKQHQTNVPRHLLDDNVVDHVVCLKAEIQSHIVLSNENDEFYTIMIYPCLRRLVCLSMESPTWWRFSLCLNGRSLVFWWRDAQLVCEFQMWSRQCWQWKSHWSQGHKRRFCRMWSTISWKHFMMYIQSN